MMVVYPDDVWYSGVQASDLQEIFESHIVRGEPVKRLRYEPGVKGATRSPVPTRAGCGLASPSFPP